MNGFFFATFLVVKLPHTFRKRTIIWLRYISGGVRYTITTGISVEAYYLISNVVMYACDPFWHVTFLEPVWLDGEKREIIGYLA